MANRGVLFAIDEKSALEIQKLPKSKIVNFILDEMEEEYFENHPNFAINIDKAWDAIHRTLTDGYLHWENGEYPLNHVILGGKLLIGNDASDDYIVVLKTPDTVKDIANKIVDVTEEIFKNNYAKIDNEDYSFKLGFDDMKYSYKWFSSLKNFFELAAKENRFVLFTVDI